MINVFGFLLCLTFLIAGQTVTVSVRSHDGVPIPACMICKSNEDTCFQTDVNGCIIVPRTGSSSIIKITASGFQDTLVNLLPDTEKFIVDMKPVEAMHQLATIRVTSTRVKSVTNLLENRSVQFTPSDIMKTAGAAEDISRYIATHPSTVASIGEGYDNTLYVRGGRPAEILFLVDNIEFENINHFSKANGSGGPVGFINSEFVDKVNFYAGTMPAEYPSRLSSVIDIRMRQGSFDQYKGTAGIKLTGGMLSAEGPFMYGKGSFAGALRYVDFSQLSKIADEKGVPKLGDIYAKLFFLHNDNLAVYCTGLLSYNTFDYTYPVTFASRSGTASYNNNNYEIERIIQGGGGITAEFGDQILQKLHITLSFRNGVRYDSLYDFTTEFFRTGFAQNPVWMNGNVKIKAALKYKAEIPIGVNDTLSGGIHANGNHYLLKRGDYSQYSGNCIECINGEPVTVEWTKKVDADSLSLSGVESGSYLSFLAHRGMLKADIGARVDYYGLQRNVSLSPSVALSVSSNVWGTLLLSYGIYHQFPSEIPMILFDNLASGRPMTTDSVKHNATKLLKQTEPYRATHYGLGYEKHFFEHLVLQSNLYFKWYDREFVFANPYHISVLKFNEDGSMHIAKQDGLRKSMGVELMVRNSNSSWYNYSVGSALFEVLNKYDDNKWYKDWTNVGYTMTITVGVSLFKYHNLSFTASAMGGRPYTSQMVFDDCIGRKYSVTMGDGGWFRDRLESIQTVNARYACKAIIQRISIEGSLELLNMFNAQPVLDYRFNGERLIGITPFGFTPVIGLTVCR